MLCPLTNSVDKIIRLTGYHYNWIDSSRGEELQTGVLAQELEEVMPELISTGEDGMKKVNYSGMIPYLIEAIKSQQKKITELESRLEKMDKK